MDTIIEQTPEVELRQYKATLRTVEKIRKAYETHGQTHQLPAVDRHISQLKAKIAGLESCAS